MLKLKLFVSVSALAVMASLSTPAHAADAAALPPASEWTISVEGNFINLNDLNLWWGAQDEAISGSVCDPTETGGYCEHNYVNPAGPLALHGWGGAVELGWKPADMGFDLLLRGRYSQTNTENISGTWGYEGGTKPDGGTASYTESHTTMDFEVGHELGIGGGLRVFGGARYARFNGQNSFATYQYESDWAGDGGKSPDQYASGTMNRTFNGIGPRIGFNGSIPIGDSILGLDYGASGALLFGDRATVLNFTEYTLQNKKPDSSTQFVMVPDVELSAALTISPSDNTKISIGYRYEEAFGVMDTGLPGVENGPNKQDRIEHGPFAKVTFKF